MTVPFTPKKKLRILIAHGAIALQRGEWILVSQVGFTTNNAAKRFQQLKKMGCAVKCACGCETWALLGDVEFDHEKQHAAGGATIIANGRPLRAVPCHREKSADENVITRKVTRVRRKLLGPRKRNRGWPPGHRKLETRKWPDRSRPLSSRSFPPRHEART